MSRPDKRKVRSKARSSRARAPVAARLPMEDLATDYAKVVGAFVEKHQDLPFRAFFRKWLATPAMRKHLCLLSVLPTPEGAQTLRFIANKVHATPMSQNIAQEDVRPVAIFIGTPGVGGSASMLNLKYEPMQITLDERGRHVPALGPAPGNGGNGSNGKK